MDAAIKEEIRKMTQQEYEALKDLIKQVQSTLSTDLVTIKESIKELKQDHDKVIVLESDHRNFIGDFEEHKIQEEKEGKKLFYRIEEVKQDIRRVDDDLKELSNNIKDESTARKIDKWKILAGAAAGGGGMAGIIEAFKAMI